MNDPHEPTPLEDAMAFLEEQDQTYTDEALYDALIDAGYPADVASEALRQRGADLESEVSAAEPTATSDTTGSDQRLEAALALTGGAILAWLACVLILGAFTGEGIGIGPVILALVLALVLLVTLVAAAASESLRRGAQGALVTFLIIPFVFFFGLAGTCVVIMSGLQG